MPRSSFYKLLLTLIVGFVGLWAGLQFGQTQTTRAPLQTEIKKSEAGSSTPSAFSLADLSGKRHGLDSWKGKVILINFWATWCAPCREEIPLFIELQKKYQSRGFQVVGIALDGADMVKPYAKEIGINYPILLAEMDGMDVMTKYGGRALPFSVFITREQQIHSRKLGVFTKEELDSLITKLL
ncbi:TlpA family protein disulfide reductase [Pseudomonadota bacterium]